MKSKFISTGLLLAFWSTILLTACSKGGSDYGSGGNNNQNPPPATGGNTITIYNMRFGSGALTVKAGTTVTWTNDDDMVHTVTADDGSFTSGSMKKGDTYNHTFSTAGTYPYHCNFHSNMKASVVVN